MNKDPFEEYKKESEPAKRDKRYAWHTAIGLQAVDGLKTSAYLVQTAVRNIEGEISFEEANALLQTYYEENPTRDASDRTEEADKVSARIAAILSERAFSFTPNEYISIHRKLFTGIYSHAGHIRDYNITKKEWVLNGETVIYGSATELRATLDYDFSEEKKFSYKNLSMDEIIHHLGVFVSRLWQIHVFREGNTRVTAVFFIKYLRTLGFDVTNDIFAENAWYFRNSLVRANYNDLKNGIYETTEYLEIFLRNLLLNESHPLHNRTLHISETFGKMSDAVYWEQPGSELGFADICAKTLDAVSDRDFVVEFISAASLIMVHLSRLSEEIVLWSSNEFGYITLDDGYSTGSSIMPQKKNPDVAELVRGKSGRVFGHLMGSLTMLKGLPLAYNKDLQEDKEALFDTVDTVKKSLLVFAPMLATMRVNQERMHERAKGGFINATDAADYLAARGVPFREAHSIIGQLVKHAEDKGVGLEDLPLAEIQQFSAVFQADIYDYISIDKCVAARCTPGGPALPAMESALKQAAGWLQENVVNNINSNADK